MALRLDGAIHRSHLLKKIVNHMKQTALKWIHFEKFHSRNSSYFYALTSGCLLKRQGCGGPSVGTIVHLLFLSLASLFGAHRGTYASSVKTTTNFLWPSSKAFHLMRNMDALCTGFVDF